MGGRRRGCHQWQHLTVEQPWSRLRVGHEQRALASPHRSPCDTVTGQSDRQCLKCLSTWLWMSFKKTGRYRKVEEDERGPPHFSLNVDRSKMSSSQPGLSPFFPFFTVSLPSAVTLLLQPSLCRKNELLGTITPTLFGPNLWTWFWFDSKLQV